MQTKLPSALFTACTAVFCLAVSAIAQPDPNNGARAENPPNNPVGVRGDATARARQQLIKFGVTDKAQQEMLVRFVLAETQARLKVAESGRKLAEALRADALDDTQIAGLLNDYQGAMEDEKARRPTALAAFKKQYDYTKNPKVEAYLVLAGIIGDGPQLMALGQGGGLAGRGGLGGAGGFNGGGFNGGGAAGGFGGRNGGGAGGVFLGGPVGRRPEAATTPGGNAAPNGAPPAGFGEGAANGPEGFGAAAPAAAPAKTAPNPAAANVAF